MTANVQAVLFDADGVLQHTPATLTSRFAALLDGRAARAAEFAADVFAAEKPAMLGKRDFRADLQNVLAAWQVDTPVDEVLAIWHDIEVADPVKDVILALREQGLPCHLATNQNPFRVAYMRRALGYATLFDEQFVSCELGLAKPDERYFQNVLVTLGVAPERLLFIDDKRTNVEAARRGGLRADRFEWSPRRKNLAELLEVLARHGVRVRVKVA